MLVLSGWLFWRGNAPFGIILAAFGLLFPVTTLQDIGFYVYGNRSVREDLGVHQWFFEHFTRMAISFIAALTAFASVQNVFGHPVGNFLLPTVIGIFLIGIMKRRYLEKRGLKKDG